MPRPTPQRFDPNSHNAMFAQVLSELKGQNKTADERHALVEGKLGSIETQSIKTNGRVTELEQERWRQRGIVTAIGLIIGALSWLLPFLWPLAHK